MDLSKEFAKAREAQKVWGQRSFAERQRALDPVRTYLIENLDSIVDVICQATGKTRVDAAADEVLPCAMAVQWYGKNAAKVLGPKKIEGASWLTSYKRSKLIHVPLGVVGIISPWNYPLTIPFGEAIMGLMAGNAIMLKTASNVVPVGRMIGTIMSHADLPDGLFQVIEGPGAEVSDAFFAGRVDKIFLTGSVGAGKDLMRRASATLTQLSLELGGNDPMIVLDDADLERASNGAAWGGFQNSGHTCAGVERVYVDAKVYEPFMELLIRKTKALRHGVETDFNVDMGAITTKDQLRIIEEHVADALAKGATIAAQSRLVGEPAGQLLFPATVLTHVTHEMNIMRDETFGPILCVMPFKTDDEAIALANDSHLALTSSVWTTNLRRGQKIATKIEAGVTTINDHIYTHALSETPWGGWKESGLGRTHGSHGLEEMSHPKVISWDLTGAKRNFFWYPSDRATYDAIGSALHFVAGGKDRLAHGARFGKFAIKKMFSVWST